MSSIKLPTRGLVGLLEDAVLTTADPKMELPHLSAVLLHTAKGTWDIPVEDAEEDDGEPLFESVPSDLLVASSTSLSMIGQAHTMCLGRLHKPVLVSTLDVESIIKVFKPLVSKRLPKTVTHTTVITYSGGTVIVAEDPDQVPDGKSLTLAAMDVDPYPRNIADLLNVDPKELVVVDGEAVPASYGTGLDPKHVDALGKISKRRKMTVAVYRHHQRGRMVVGIGSSYRAVLMPYPLKEDTGQHLEPQVEVFTPPLPKREKPSEQQTEPLVPA
jgi:hypothetical protein